MQQPIIAGHAGGPSIQVGLHADKHGIQDVQWMFGTSEKVLLSGLWASNMIKGEDWLIWARQQRDCLGP